MKIKYLAAILIGVAALGLQQAKATNFVSYLTVSNGGPGPNGGYYGTVTVSGFNAVTQTATITFDANTAGGYYFVDGGAAAVNLTGNSATASFVSETPNNFKDFSYNANNDGFGQFTVRLNNMNSSVHVTQIVFTVTNTSGTLWTSNSDVLAFNSKGWDASAHYIDTNIGAPNTFYAGEGHGTVPDGGATVMLLGVALGALGVVRRYLTS